MPDDRFDPTSPGALGRLLRAQGLLSSTSGSVPRVDAVSGAGPIVPGGPALPALVPMGAKAAEGPMERAPAPPPAVNTAPRNRPLGVVPVPVPVSPPVQQQPPVTVNVIGNGGAPPPVSSELPGSPSYQDLVRAQGGAPPVPSIPIPPPAAGLPADPNAPLPSMRDRLLLAQGASPQAQGQPQTPPTVTPAPLGGPPVPGVPAATPAPTAAPQTTPDVGPVGVPPDERLPLGDEDDYVPTQADMDPTTWTPPKAPPEGLTPAPNGRPGQYLDGARRTVWRTGDPRRDSFLERESGLVEGIISDHPQMRLSDSQREALGFTGETPEENAEAIQVIGNRPDPYMIDAKARRYAAAAMPEPLAQLDPRTGRPVPPSEDDLAYVQARNLDQGFSDRVESLARERATEEERAARALPLQEEHARSAMAVADQRRELLDRYVADHRRFWDEARGAQARADAMYPNPDDLLGGEGSWSRAMALGIASVNSPVAFQGLSAVINSQMALEWAGQQAAYGRERQREATALGNAEEAYRTMATEDGARVAQGAAAKERLAAGLELVGARTADQAVQAKYQGLAGQLRLEAAKDLGAMATQMANRDLKDAQLAMKGMHYDTKLHRWVSMFGDGGGGTGGPGGAPGQAVQSPTNPFGKLGVREPDRSGRPGGWWQSSDDDSAKKAREAGIEYGKLDDAINQMQVLAAQAKGAKSAGAQAWSKWQSEHEAEYKLAFLNATQLAARVLHGRPPGKFTMQEVHDEYPQLASAWESNNVEGVIRWLRDDADRNYNKSMHQYGYNGTYLSDRPTPTQAPTAEELRRSVVGDYVPGHAPDVEAAVGQNRGGSADDRGALGAYVKEYYTLLNGTDGGLASSLDEMRRKADGNRLRAVQRKDVAGASKWRVIAESIGSQAAEVRSGTARKAIEAQRAAEAERNRLGDSLMRLPH